MGVKTIKDDNIIYFVDNSIKTIEILVFLAIDDKFTINDMIQVFNSKTINLYKSYDIIDISCVIITNSRKWW